MHRVPGVPAAAGLLVGAGSDAAATRPAPWAFAVLALGLLLGGLCLHRGRRCPPAAIDREDPAVAAALAARRRRRRAQALAAADPLLADDLRIGRPDLPHGYDDGGLVDLTTAPAAAIAAACRVAPELAGQIAALRTGGVVVRTVDEVLTLLDVPVPLWDRIHDRAVVIVR